MKRRTFIQALPIFGVAGAMPATSAQAAEPICDKIDRLTQELSCVMTEYLNGQFKAVVGPHNEVSLVPAKIAPDRRLHLAVDEIRRAMSEKGEDDFMVVVMVCPDSKGARIVNFKTGVNVDIDPAGRS